jgi:hypothetical protein
MVSSWVIIYPGLLCIVLLSCIFVTSCVLFYTVCIAVLHTLVAGLLVGSQYPEGPRGKTSLSLHEIARNLVFDYFSKIREKIQDT